MITKPRRQRCRYKRSRWTADKIAKLKQLRDSGMTQEAMAKEFNLTLGAIKARIIRLKLGPAPKKKANRPKKYKPRDWPGNFATEAIVVPPEVWADRDRRLMAGYPDLTAMVMGDPERGRSALDQKRKLVSA